MIPAFATGEGFNIELGAAYLAFRRAIVETLERLKLPVENADEYINNRALRDDLIVAEYQSRREQGEKSEAVIFELSKKYSLAWNSVYNIVHRK